MALLRSQVVAIAVALLGCRDDTPRASSGPPTIIPTTGGWGSRADLAKLPGELWYVAASVPPKLVRIAAGTRDEIADAVVPHDRLVGVRLVGVQSQAGSERIVLVGRDGAIEAIGPAAREISDVVVDPGGTWIIATASDAVGAGSDAAGSRVLRIDLGDARTVIELAQGQDAARLGADRIVYTSGGDIFSVAVSGGPPAALASGPGDDRDPRANRDGSAIVFESDREGPRRLFLWRDGSVTRLTERTEITRDEHSHVWSPDGRLVAYVVQRGIRRHVWIRDVDAKSEIDITPEGMFDGEPAFSPDGRWIVVSRTRGKDVDLWAIPTGVGEPLRVTTGRFPDVGPRWL